LVLIEYVNASTRVIRKKPMPSDAYIYSHRAPAGKKNRRPLVEYPSASVKVTHEKEPAQEVSEYEQQKRIIGILEYQQQEERKWREHEYENDMKAQMEIAKARALKNIPKEKLDKLTTVKPSSFYPGDTIIDPKIRESLVKGIVREQETSTPLTEQQQEKLGFFDQDFQEKMGKAAMRTAQAQEKERRMEKNPFYKGYVKTKESKAYQIAKWAPPFTIVTLGTIGVTKGAQAAAPYTGKAMDWIDTKLDTSILAYRTAAEREAEAAVREGRAIKIEGSPIDRVIGQSGVPKQKEPGSGARAYDGGSQPPSILGEYWRTPSGVFYKAAELDLTFLKTGSELVRFGGRFVASDEKEWMIATLPTDFGTWVATAPRRTLQGEGLKVASEVLIAEGFAKILGKGAKGAKGIKETAGEGIGKSSSKLRVGDIIYEAKDINKAVETFEGFEIVKESNRASAKISDFFEKQKTQPKQLTFYQYDATLKSFENFKIETTKVQNLLTDSTPPLKRRISMTPNWEMKSGDIRGWSSKPILGTRGESLDLNMAIIRQQERSMTTASKNPIIHGKYGVFENVKIRPSIDKSLFERYELERSSNLLERRKPIIGRTADYLEMRPEYPGPGMKSFEFDSFTKVKENVGINTNFGIDAMLKRASSPISAIISRGIVASSVINFKSLKNNSLNINTGLSIYSNTKWTEIQGQSHFQINDSDLQLRLKTDSIKPPPSPIIPFPDMPMGGVIGGAIIGGAIINRGGYNWYDPINYIRPGDGGGTWKNYNPLSESGGLLKKFSVRTKEKSFTQYTPSVTAIGLNIKTNVEGKKKTQKYEKAAKRSSGLTLRPVIPIKKKPGLFERLGWY